MGSLGQFFVEGGWGMYPVLVFGLILLVAAGQFAWDTELLRLRFVTTMVALLFVAMGHAILMNVAQVFWFVSESSRVADADFARTITLGLMESTRPGGLGGVLLSLALVLVAVGVYRHTQRELRAA